MKMRVKPSRGYLTIELSGEFDLNLFIDLMPRILDACASRGTSKLLLDARPLRGGASMTDRYFFAETFARLYKERRVAGTVKHVQFAMLAKSPLLDPQRFGEKVATARGLQLKAFAKLWEARAWLEVNLPKGEKDAPKPPIIPRSRPKR